MLNFLNRDGHVGSKQILKGPSAIEDSIERLKSEREDDDE